MTKRKTEADFWALVDKNAPGGCWAWRGDLNEDGYGKFGGIAFHPRARRVFAHRLSYQFSGGELIAGLEIDHLCRNRACVNPQHMEQVDHRTNSLRGMNPMAHQARQTACRHGHAFTPENVYTDPRGHRACRACRRLIDREREKRRRVVNGKRTRRPA